MAREEVSTDEHFEPWVAEISFITWFFGVYLHGCTLVVVHCVLVITLESSCHYRTAGDMAQRSIDVSISRQIEPRAAGNKIEISGRGL